MIFTWKSSDEENKLVMSEAWPRSIDSKEGLLMNIPFCSEMLLKFKEDKFRTCASQKHSCCFY